MPFAVEWLYIIVGVDAFIDPRAAEGSRPYLYTPPKTTEHGVLFDFFRCVCYTEKNRLP